MALFKDFHSYICEKCLYLSQSFANEDFYGVCSTCGHTNSDESVELNRLHPKSYDQHKWDEIYEKESSTIKSRILTERRNQKIDDLLE